MSKSKKIWLGVLTFVPLLFVVIYLVLFFTVFYSVFELSAAHGASDELPSGFIFNFMLLAVLIIIASLTGLGIMIYYALHANKNPDFNSSQKTMWILLLILVGSVSTIVYYFMYILPDREKERIEA